MRFLTVPLPPLTSNYALAHDDTNTGSTCPLTWVMGKLGAHHNQIIHNTALGTTTISIRWILYSQCGGMDSILNKEWKLET